MTLNKTVQIGIAAGGLAAVEIMAHIIANMTECNEAERKYMMVAFTSVGKGFAEGVMNATGDNLSDVPKLRDLLSKNQIVELIEHLRGTLIGKSGDMMARVTEACLATVSAWPETAEAMKRQVFLTERFYESMLALSSDDIEDIAQTLSERHLKLVQ